MARSGFYRLLALFVFIWLSLSLKSVISDSFYGTSYSHLRLSEDIPATNITLRFRTSRTRGLFLYATNHENFLIVRLREAKIEAVLGLGEFEITLQYRRRPKLNNLKWHKVQVIVSNNQALLFLNGERRDSGDVPQDSLGLRDIYLGGTADMDNEHLSGADKYFRGCLEDVTIGNINVLAASKTTRGSVYHDITEDCSVEFEAGRDDPYSFVKETAFVLFPKWHIRGEGSFSCWVRTSASHGLLMFSHRGSEFRAAEIDSGRIRVMVKSASNADTTSVMSQKIINDRTWHFVLIEISSNFIRISVDREAEQYELSAPVDNPTEFLGTLYVGGVIHRARAIAFSSGLTSITHASTGGSLQGCIQDVELNGEAYALGDSHATHGIQVGCIYEFPCSESPCESEKQCVEVGPADFYCSCVGEECMESAVVTLKSTSTASLVSTKSFISMTTYAVTTLAPTVPPFTLFSTQPLLIREGGGSRITSTNIEININLRDYKIRQSQLLFNVAQHPEYGRIEKDVLRRGMSRVRFTYLDLLTGKISYIHDGSENFIDQVVFAVSCSGKTYGIPIELQGPLNLTLPIEITPANDAPDIVIADGNTFRMIQNTKRVLQVDFINAYDPDTLPSDVVIDIISQQNNVGYFEHMNQPGESVTQFSQADINNNNIAYVHIGPSVKSRVALRASDGIAKSGVASFRIEAAQLELEVANLSSLRTNPAVGLLISPANLEVVTNDPEAVFNVTFLITTPPRLGDVQKQDSSGLWKTITEFSQNDIDMGKVRYIASRVENDVEISRDQIGLVARSGTVTKPGIYLPVEILKTSIEVVVNTGLILDVVDVGFITVQNLSAEAVNVLDSSPITYEIVRPPSQGFINKHLVGELLEGHSFTQQDIEAGLITYNLHGQHLNYFNDTLLLRAMIPSAHTEPTDFIISYFPDSEQIDITNNGFTVEEGNTYLIRSTDLFLRTGGTSDFSYTVTSPPNNGVLQLRDSASGNVVNSNVTSFLNYDISREALQYTHDDSETSFDSFSITGSATVRDRLGRLKVVRYRGTVNISVELQNDNSPVRIVDKVFKVIKNGRTVLTAEDLLYTDADIDFDDGDLLYQRQRTDSGNLVETDDHTQSVFSFKQKDLVAGKITFKHIGSRQKSRMLFLVFDKGRKHYVAGFLQIEAFESYLNISLNTGLYVEFGKSAVITNRNLSTETNINVKNRNINYHITSGPAYGYLVAEDVAIQQFTQESLDNEVVMYQHNNRSKNLTDSFNYTVTAKGIETRGQFVIRVLVANKTQLPTVTKMEPIVVEAGEEIVLTKFNLKISHPNHLASEIVYKVTSPPKYGILQLRNEFGIIVSRSPPLSKELKRKRRNSNSAMSFTQQDVNRGYVSYIQTDYSQLIDEFSFEVSNGYSTLSNISLTIDIAPTIIPLEVHNFTVLEDRSKTITSDIIRVGHVLYEPLELTIHILESPQFGIIENTRQPGRNLQSFTTQDISNEFIYYVHDGSEKSTDGFKFSVNNSEGKHSDVYTVHITVEQINDQPPVVVLNRGLWAVTGSITPLTNVSLSASDPDTPDRNLTFTITSPGNGFITYRNSDRSPVLSFSQSDLNSRNVLFVHQGSTTGGFRFQVSDGVHLTQQQIFSIRAAPLRLRVANNTQLEITPGSTTPLTSSNLQVLTNEDPATELSRPVRYSVTAEPVTGSIVKILSQADASTTVSYKQTSEFTQEDIDMGIIAFVHDNSTSPVKDSVRFNVFLPLSQNLSDITFQIRIFDAILPSTVTPNASTTSIPMQSTTSSSDSNGIINTGMELLEGDKVTVTGGQLNADSLLSGLAGYVQYVVTKTPQHGFLTLSGRNISVGDTFTQQELSSLGLGYTHDHSDTDSDSFNFTASVKLFAASIVAPGATIPKVDGIFKIQVLPVNDQKSTVVTASLRMSVVQGERVSFNSRYLSIIDPDNSPSEINIKVLSPPSNGKLVYTDDPSSVARTFTQADINNDQLEFIHDGGSARGAFLFRVDDGKHFQIKQFFIDVVPRILNLNSVALIVLPQGDTSVIITDHNLNITSNGNISTSFYNVSVPPSFGEIRKDSLRVLTFTQSDIEQGVVSYFQNDMSSASDFLQLTLFDDFNVIPSINISVNVHALIETSSILTSSHSSVPLENFHLNATELAVKTRSVPYFELVTPPEFGTLVNESTGEMIYNFSATDISNRYVVYLADNLDIAENNTMVDNFTLLSLANGAQPVHIILTAVISPKLTESTTWPFTVSRTTDTLVANEDVDIFLTSDDNGLQINDADEDEQTTEGIPLDDPNAMEVRSDSWSVIYITLSVVVILIVFIIILVIVLWKRRQRKKAKQEPVSTDDYPDTVTAAPVMMPETANLKAAEPRGEGPYDSSTVTQPMISRPQQSPLVPQVRVTALGRPPSPVNSYASLTSNGTFQSSAFSNNWNTGDTQIFGSVRSRSPALKKSQYWV